MSNACNAANQYRVATFNQAIGVAVFLAFVAGLGAALLVGLWLAAVAEVVLVGPVVSRLSDLKGNAGMDVVGVLLAPVLAFAAWAGVAGAARIRRAA